METNSELPRSAKDCCDTAAIHLENGRPDLALDLYKQAVRIDPRNIFQRVAIFNIYFSRNQVDLALGCFFELLDSRSFELPSEFILGVTKWLIDSGRVSDILRVYTILIEKYPNDYVYYDQKYALEKRVGYWDRALITLRKMLEIWPELGDSSNKVHVNNEFVARIYVIQEALRLAHTRIAGAAPHLPSGTGTQEEKCRVAVSFVASGQLADAMFFLKQVLNEVPANQLALFCLGTIYFHIAQVNSDSGLMQESLQLFEALIRVNPNFADAHYMVGQVLESSHGRTQEAIALPMASYLRAVQLNPRMPDAYREIGILMQQQGKAVRSYAMLQEYMQLREEIAAKHPLGRLGIRFIGEVNSYAIGHMTDMPLTYVMAKKLGLMPDYKIIWLAPPGRIANHCLLSYWDEHFEIVRDGNKVRELAPLINDIEIDTSFFKMPSGLTLNTRVAVAAVSQAWDKAGNGPVLKLRAEHIEKGEACLRRMGLPKGAWFVGLHARDAGFKRESNCVYNGHRIATIENYFSAIRKITDAGGWVIRMGEPSMPAIPEMPNVIDYARSPHKSDWMDIYLCAAGRFFIGSSAGILLVPQLFGAPVVATNLSPTPYRQGSRDIFLPKLLWKESENRYCTFAEVFQPPIYESESGVLLQELGLKSIENTPEDLAEAIAEMINKLDGIHIYDSEDERMQEHYRSLAPVEGRFYSNRIGRDFLRKNKNLL